MNVNRFVGAVVGVWIVRVALNWTFYAKIVGRQLSARRETPFFTDRERAALAWTEAITLISSGQTSDEVYEEVRQRFTEEELVNLTLAIVAINGWNRLAIGFRAVLGSYQPAAAQGVAAGRSR